MISSLCPNQCMMCGYQSEKQYYTGVPVIVDMPTWVNYIWNWIKCNIVHRNSTNEGPDKVSYVNLCQIFNPGISDIDEEICQIICASIRVNRNSILLEPKISVPNRIQVKWLRWSRIVSLTRVCLFLSIVFLILIRIVRNGLVSQKVGANRERRHSNRM